MFISLDDRGWVIIEIYNEGGGLNFFHCVLFLNLLFGYYAAEQSERYKYDSILLVHNTR